MKLLGLVWRYSRRLVVLAIIAGIISGLSNAALIGVVHRALVDGRSALPALGLVFIAVCLGLPISRLISQVLLTYLAQKATFDLRMTLARRILAAPLRQLEEVGPARQLAALTEDVTAISTGVGYIPVLCLHFSILIGCLAYLAWLNWSVFIGVVIFLIVGMASFQLAVGKASRFVMLARADQDNLYRSLRSLTSGTKELKLHRKRRETFVHKLLQGSAAAYQRHSVVGNGVYTAAASWGQLLFFVLVGLLVFVVPSLKEISAATLTGYTLIILYMMVPLEVLSGGFALVGRANVSLNQIESLGLSLHADPSSEQKSGESKPPSWHTLELDGVVRTYHLEKDNSSFILGPINLILKRGELVFISGGNGSGKTTLAKLLAGLYPPEAGEIRLDGQSIKDGNINDYRELFSVVFSDFYLFESLLGLDTPKLDDQARAYLSQLQLESKVQIKDGVFSTVDLSQGQRKRLALLTAYLEDRPIYLFDEWAADQDPMFKDVFYYQLLPEMKAKGKTVIVISHDDRYYSVGDRLIKLDTGRLVLDEPVMAAAPAMEKSASFNVA